MNRTRVLIAVASGIFLMLVIMFVTSLPSPEGPGTKDPVTQAQPEITQAGNYELTPGGPGIAESPIDVVAEYTVVADPQAKPARKTKPALPEIEDPGYDTINPGIIEPPRRSPSADDLRQMQKRGIVAY
ncbi:MAG: hypothetical protein WC481_04110 [Candidatus Omnitrophota bacterium]